MHLGWWSRQFCRQRHFSAAKPDEQFPHEQAMAESAFMTGTQQDHVLAIVGLNPFFDGRKALAHDFPVNGGILQFSATHPRLDDW